MKKIKFGLLSLVAMFAVVGAGAYVASPAYADCKSTSSPADCIQDGINKSGGASKANTVPIGERINTIVNILLFILGAIAVVMIVIGGIRYTTSNGEASAMTSAKNTILYAVVGLVIAIMAYAIVNFVVKAFI